MDLRLASSVSMLVLNSEYSAAFKFWPEPRAKINCTSSQLRANDGVAKGRQTAVKATALTAPIEKVIFSYTSFLMYFSSIAYP